MVLEGEQPHCHFLDEEAERQGSQTRHCHTARLGAGTRVCVDLKPRGGGALSHGVTLWLQPPFLTHSEVGGGLSTLNQSKNKVGFGK